MRRQNVRVPLEAGCLNKRSGPTVTALMLSRHIDIVRQDLRLSSFCKHEAPSRWLDGGAAISGRQPDGQAISVKSGRTRSPAGAGGRIATGGGVAGTTIAMTRGAGVTIEAQPPSAMATVEITRR